MVIVAVLGSGIIATALSSPMGKNGHEIHLVGTHLDREIVDSVRKTGIRPDLGLKVNPGVSVYQLRDAPTASAGVDVVMCGMNSSGIEWITEQLKTLLRPEQKLLYITRGVRADADGTLHLLPEVIQNVPPKELAEQVPWSMVVDLSVAEEVAVHRDAAVVFYGCNKNGSEYLADLFRIDYYHVQTSLDFVGHETGAATRNVYAFAAGFTAESLKAQGKENDRYVMYSHGFAIFTRGQEEVRQSVTFMGGTPEAADGPDGVGDTFITSMDGRNVKAGILTDQRIPFSQVCSVHTEGMTPKSITATSAVDKALRVLISRGVAQGTDFPLCRFLYSVVEENAPLKMSWDRFFTDLRQFSGASDS